MQVQSPTDYLREIIASHGGAISVERFMQEALYHPRHGYYANRVRQIGRGGDFSTAATLHDALPRALARWATSHRAEASDGGCWHLIELGGGTGHMAAELIGSLGWLARRKLRYHLVEISRPLRMLQQQRLHRFRRVVRWHDDISQAIDSSGGRALVFSNEFVDAFPCVQLSRTSRDGEAGWDEVMLSWSEASSGLVETLRPWTAKEGEETLFSALTPQHETLNKGGRRIEIQRAYKQWLEEWVPRWRSGRLLTIDYGDLMPALYHRQHHGTLRAYALHQRLTGTAVYSNFGQQDITVDVNFTDLQAWGKPLRLDTADFCPQAAFLNRWLPPRYITKAVVSSAAFRYLIDHSGAGSAFKVLEQLRSEERCDEDR